MNFSEGDILSVWEDRCSEHSLIDFKDGFVEIIAFLNKGEGNNFMVTIHRRDDMTFMQLWKYYSFKGNLLAWNFVAESEFTLADVVMQHFGANIAGYSNMEEIR